MNARGRVAGMCVAMLLLGLVPAMAGAAGAGCSVQAPQTARSGAFFTIRLDLGGGSYGILRRDDGTVVATTSATTNARVYATNVLGQHTYTLTVGGASTSTCSATVDVQYIPDPVQGYDIVIIAGQSNAAGMGFGPFSDPTSATIDSKIVQIGRIGASDMQVVPVGYWQGGVLSDGLHFWKRDEGEMGMSFALSFARQYVRKELVSDRKVLLVPAAYGGTTILQWLGLPCRAAPQLYADMVARTKAALALPGENRVVAFLWQQGESDVSLTLDQRCGMSASTYRQHLGELFAKFRADIPEEPRYPILAGLMVPSWNATGTALLAKRAIQRAIVSAAKDDPLAGVVSSAALTSNADIGLPGGAVHFNAKSLVALGRRYFTAWGYLVHGATSAETEDAAMGQQGAAIAGAVSALQGALSRAIERLAILLGW